MPSRAMAPWLACFALQAPAELVVTAAGLEVRESCVLVLPDAPLADPHPDLGGASAGAIRITGEGIEVGFRGTLRGASEGTDGDRLEGAGLVVTGERVTLRGARVAGYKVGIWARGADGLRIEDCDLSGNYRQRLRSTRAAEDPADWLWPHANDGNEWLRSWGAAIYLEDCRGALIRGCRARDGQNGILLDRVEGAEIFDNDFSFLSGWGLGLWRSSGNRVTRNAFDFCVRGYSHRVYNRGQDSAGILLFEQSSRNVFAENSATHGGDGLFGFGGREALGEVPAGPASDAGFDARRKGCNDNLFVDNDFSYAAAHGLELTFSFGNRIERNRFVENAICGIWGGYSQETRIEGNHFEGNGSAGYGAERGGIAIEHGRRNAIVGNEFLANACGVRLWWDPDPQLAELPWAHANGVACDQNRIAGNRFTADEVGIELEDAEDTRLSGNTMTRVAREIEGTAHRDEDSDPAPEGTAHRDEDSSPAPVVAPLAPLEVRGESRPVGARAKLRGRDRILLTEWGPYDWNSPLLVRVDSPGPAHAWRLIGAERMLGLTYKGPVRCRVVLDTENGQQELRVEAETPGSAAPYALVVRTPSGEARGEALLLAVRWDVRVFAWTRDPREDLEAWRAEAGGAVAFQLDRLELAYGLGGPSGIAGAGEAARALPTERFGTLARTRVLLPAGRWRIRTLSDDGVRVLVDGRTVLEDWTWHGPTRGEALFEVPGRQEVELQVEHFELDGYAVLSLDLEPAPQLEPESVSAPPGSERGDER